MRADEPIHDDPVIRKVAAARPPVPEDDLSPDGWRARAIEARVLSGSAPVPSPRPRARWARPVRRIVTEGPAPRERHRIRRGRWVGALRSGVGFAATVAVVVVIVIVVITSGSHARRDITTPAAVHPVPGTAPPAPTSLLPAHGGMRGLLSTDGLFGSGSDLTASFYQCSQCRTRLHSGGTEWNSRSVDGGRTWRTEPVSAPRMDLGAEVQAGDTVWATGELGSTPTFFVSHDDGHHYTAATSAATSASESPLTISDGTVWALGNRCDGHRCRAVVLSGLVGGDRLTATASQPALRQHVNGVQAVIGARGSTVVITGGYATADLQTFVSHDRGRSWTEVSYPCRRPVEGDVYPTSARSLWAVCLATLAPASSTGHPTEGTPRDIIRRSTDGGRHWTTTSTLAQEQPTLAAVTDRVAWITGITGTIERTTDGGRTWQTVLQVPSGADGNADLAVQDAQTATIVVAASTGNAADHDRRTDLVSYRTTDGGAHWTPTVIKLPTG